MGALLTRRREMILPGGGGSWVENFTRVGNPTIEDGIMTASSSAWITTPESFNPGSNPWAVTIKLYRPSRLNNYEGFCYSGGVQLRTPWNSNNVTIDLYSDGGTIVSGKDNKSVPAGSWKWLRVVFGGTAATGYDYGISTDGLTYTYLGGGNEPFTGYRNAAYKSATPIKAGVFSLGHANTYNSIAKYDLMETKIEINGSVWWTPYVRG